jgi:hypothetical protein
MRSEIALPPFAEGIPWAHQSRKEGRGQPESVK